MANVSNDYLASYEAKKSQLMSELKSSSHPIVKLKKTTPSNLFRYEYLNQASQKAIAIKNFTDILSLDAQNHILDVEGLTPYEKIVSYTLQQGCLPLVAPELKHITIGGAIVGIGIESTSFRYGFVHDGLLEAEVLLPNGQIILCNPHNEHADLFFALPNSYGTLGYILRAKIKLYPAEPYVHLISKRFSDVTQFIDAMQQATVDSAIHFVEGLVFSKNELYLLLGRFVTKADRLDDIYRKNIFYKLIQKQKDLFLTTQDYIFRYDPDWFWNIPDTIIYKGFRRFAPLAWRHSGFYKKYIDFKKKVFSKLHIYPSLDKEEPLIQDWEVPWDQGHVLLQFALQNIDLNGKPWAVVPIKPLNPATLYPLKPHHLYFNLGCYCSSKTKQGHHGPYHNTKLMDSHCFMLGGLKMLYSSSMFTLEQFNQLYNGDAYQQLKQKYDPAHLSQHLYEKVNLNA